MRLPTGRAWIRRLASDVPSVHYIGRMELTAERTMHLPGMATKAPFRLLSEQEFQKLTLEERMDYLHRAMADMRGKLEMTRQQAAAIKKLGQKPPES